MNLTVKAAEGWRSGKEHFFESFEEADSYLNLLRIVGSDSLSMGGYIKVDFTIEFECGVYKGRFDLERDKFPHLEPHVRDNLLFQMGRKCPSDWSYKEYEMVLSRGKVNKALAEKMLGCLGRSSLPHSAKE